MPTTMALGIQYDGSQFCGWQIQPDQRTVQAELERALEKFLCARTATFCAGRTDTGVHAVNQVVSFSSPVDRPERNWVRALNTFLPSSVAVRWARKTPEDFHARFSAESRTYEYWIYNSEIRSPIYEGRTGWVFRRLDLEKMIEASRLLLGEHDFTSFRASECQAATPVRTIHSIDAVRRGDLIGIRLTANAFLQHMVRNIVGSLIYVGSGRESVEWMRDVLEAKDRSVAAPTFSPSGLYFTGVEYPGFDLPRFGPSPFGWEAD